MRKGLDFAPEFRIVAGTTWSLADGNASNEASRLRPLCDAAQRCGEEEVLINRRCDDRLPAPPPEVATALEFSGIYHIMRDVNRTQLTGFARSAS